MTDRWSPHGARATVGVARSDVTPPVGIRARNWGAARSDRATGVHHPITVRALCIEAADGPRYLVTLDLISLRTEADHSFRERLQRELGVGEDRILLHCIHTHAGPCSNDDEVGLPGGDLVPAFLESVYAGIVDACRRAGAGAEPCELTWAYGHCDVAAVRDLPCGERDLCGFNPDVVADDTVAVGRITARDGRPVAVLLNYACHPTTLAWDNSLLSPDYVGAARETVEAATGARCLFLQGASGELSPRVQYVGDAGLADAYGRSLGYAALSAIESMPPPGAALSFAGTVESGAPLALWRPISDERRSTLGWHRVDVPVRLKPHLTAEQVAALWPHLERRVAEERTRRAQRLRGWYADRDRAHHPVWLWQLGDAVIVAQAGEAYSALQTELRRRHPERTLFVLNLTNSPGNMYLPAAGAYDRDRYQVWQTLYERGTLEGVIDAVDAALGRLPAGRGG